MTPFTTLTGVAAPLPMANVDTDKIIPARFMKTIQKTGLGKNLFDGLRYDSAGQERDDFILNQGPFRQAEILIAYENFGCGSSREHAPWALVDFGIRCIISPGFADIFFGNCFKNGILPICLPKVVCDRLMNDARMGSNARLHVDLERQVVVRPNGEEIAFKIDPSHRTVLLEGLDDITMTMQRVATITTFERTHVKVTQSIYPDIAPGAFADG